MSRTFFLSFCHLLFLSSFSSPSPFCLVSFSSSLSFFAFAGLFVWSCHCCSHIRMDPLHFFRELCWFSTQEAAWRSFLTWDWLSWFNEWNKRLADRWLEEGGRGWRSCSALSLPIVFSCLSILFSPLRVVLGSSILFVSFSFSLLSDQNRQLYTLLAIAMKPSLLCVITWAAWFPPISNRPPTCALHKRKESMAKNWNHCRSWLTSNNILLKMKNDKREPRLLEPVH